MMLITYFPIIISLFAIVFVVFLIFQISKSSASKGKALEITQAIQEGATSYLKRQSKTIAAVALVMVVLLWFFIGWKASIGFCIGALLSGLSGFIGMWVSTQTNTRVAQAATRPVRFAFELSFKGGLVTGLLVVSLGLLAVSGYYKITNDIQALIALGFGASLIAMFARVGGGIYTKAADIGADLVAKLEKNIPEDDPRNPAVIADQVGDNVGGCAGMAADIFQTYVVTIAATMMLGALLFPRIPQFVLLPLFLGSISILTSIIGSFFVKIGKNNSIMWAMYKGLLISVVLSAIGFYPLISNMMAGQDISVIDLYLSTLVGLVIALGMFVIVEYYTAKKYGPVKSIAKASETGHATNVIRGIAVGMHSTAFPAVLIAAGIIASFWLAGVYGVAMAAVSMLSLCAMVVGIDAYGPITDNAAGIVKMSQLPEEAHTAADTLSLLGNTTKAVTKGYAIASAALASIVLFAAYSQKVINLTGSINAVNFALDNPNVIAGLLIGGLLPYLFTSFLMGAVGKTASKVVQEVRRQFASIKGLMEGTGKPEYAKCVDIVTKAALREMMIPVIITVLAPIAVGWILGVQALGGLLIGSIITGLFLGLSMTTGGAAWDSAKKYIEGGAFGGRGSLAHQAALTGDAVGDPYKDTAGPSINPMIKVLNIVALLIVAFLV